MPFKSDKQRRYLYAKEPAVAAKFAAEEDEKKARQDAAKKKFYGPEYKPDVYKKPVTLASEKSRRSKASPPKKAAPPVRTEGARMGEFDLDRIESAGKGKPRVAVMVGSDGDEHNIKLTKGQRRPSEAQLDELRLRLGVKEKSAPKSEAFRRRVLERKRRERRRYRSEAAQGPVSRLKR